MPENATQEMDKKAKRKAEKQAKKDAKKAAKEGRKGGEAVDDEDEESLGIIGRLIMAVVVLFIIVIWLVIFAFIVKMDVGGFGSTVLFPVLKDVPYVNRILPGIEDYIGDEVNEDDGYAYDTVDEAVVRIKELEQEVEELKNQDSSNSDYITELEAAKAELEEYKANEADFESEKEKFYQEVVFSDNAPDINEYKTYYESIEPETAESIYKQVVSQLATDEELEDYVAAYSAMSAKNAAAIFDSMTDNFDLVCQILSAMDSGARADILAAMSSQNAAIVTEMMKP